MVKLLMWIMRNIRTWTSAKKEEALYKIGHKIYYDFQVNDFFFCQDIYDYGTIHRAPEFLLTLSGFGKEVASNASEWEELSQPYVVKFKARITEFLFTDA